MTMRTHTIWNFLEGDTCVYCSLRTSSAIGQCPAMPAQIITADKWIQVAERNRKTLRAEQDRRGERAPPGEFITGRPWMNEATWVPCTKILDWYALGGMPWPSHASPAPPAPKAPTCECGVAKVGGVHSDWCAISPVSLAKARTGKRDLDDIVAVVRGAYAKTHTLAGGGTSP